VAGSERLYRILADALGWFIKSQRNHPSLRLRHCRLVQVSRQTIKGVLRQEDLFFRYGGEEFVILVKDAHSEQAYTVLERCRSAIESKRFPQVDKVTVSIGYANLESNALHFAGTTGEHIGITSPVFPRRGVWV
jgi:hypothetical protein